MTTLLRSTALALALALGAPAAAFAVDVQTARTLVQDTASRVIAIVGDGSVAGEEAQMRAILTQYADVRQIAGFALGRYSRDMPEARREEYVDLFTNYVLRWFTDRFTGYNGEMLSIVGATDLGDRGVVVNTQINRPGTAPVNVQWSVSDRSGSPKVADLVIEGASLAQTQRSEFVAMIEARGGDMNAFLSDLRARAGR
ncbi:phospholipid-binding protein MlaC [Neomegalonema sp.]|uniref:MlaC/ttg2D family ABC transporter substrate-binding protein n=1 Tax=Neomegalonema sp. TaxID=2039713 RepID=UPI00260BF340|nr:ABC transporter substrate-binding protein [Neomegalonema sp.]MDD2869463.1 ABC transporter substrate-binding protein [Neomegalonema sp.]